MRNRICSLYNVCIQLYTVNICSNNDSRTAPCYTVLCTLYSVYCTTYNVRHMLYNVDWNICSVWRRLNDFTTLQIMMFIIASYTLTYSIRCTVYDVQCTLFTVRHIVYEYMSAFYLYVLIIGNIIYFSIIVCYIIYLIIITY